jgi:hypothetical protein
MDISIFGKCERHKTIINVKLFFKMSCGSQPVKIFIDDETVEIPFEEGMTVRQAYIKAYEKKYNQKPTNDEVEEQSFYKVISPKYQQDDMKDILKNRKYIINTINESKDQ